MLEQLPRKKQIESLQTLKSELVFEISFKVIILSNRHKSGEALRVQRILRWRKDNCNLL